MEKSFLQLQAELSSFNDGGRRSREQQMKDFRVEDVPVIPHVTHRIDPTNENADWGGKVPLQSRKRVYSKDEHMHRSNLATDETGGIVPATSTNQTNSRKLYSSKVDLHQTSIDPDAKDSPLRTAVYQMGPGGKHNCDGWKTSYELATADPSTVEIDPNSGVPVPLKQRPQRKQITPLYEQYHQRNQTQPIPNESITKPNRSLPVRPGRSLLAGIGRTLASNDRDGNLMPEFSSVKPAYSAPSNKSLVAENYKEFGINYSGHRKF